MKKMQLLTILLLVGSATQAQVLSPEAYRTIRASASGQRALGDFRNLTQFSGFAPSAGADQIANYLLLETSRLGLANRQHRALPLRRQDLRMGIPHRTILGSAPGRTVAR